jgi:hypothetical protein
MSVPYHIGSGYFGGFLPLISQYNRGPNRRCLCRLWYTIAVVAMAFVVSAIWLPETPTRNWTERVGAPIRFSRDQPSPPTSPHCRSCALVANWRWLDRMSGPAACGAAVKADGYGLGAAEAVTALANAGCRHFFVSTWAEAEPLFHLTQGLSLSVLHGLAEEDVPLASAAPARPVLNTPAQVARWRTWAAATRVTSWWTRA